MNSVERRERERLATYWQLVRVGIQIIRQKLGLEPKHVEMGTNDGVTLWVEDTRTPGESLTFGPPGAPR